MYPEEINGIVWVWLEKAEEQLVEESSDGPKVVRHLLAVGGR